MALSRKNRTGDKVAASVGSTPVSDGRIDRHGERWSGVNALHESQGLLVEVPAGTGFTAQEYAEHFKIKRNTARHRMKEFTKDGLLVIIGKRNGAKVYDTPAVVGKPNGRKH
jgi:predicted HTH transcriptional regulator